jgi:hypothetical protein
LSFRSTENIIEQKKGLVFDHLQKRFRFIFWEEFLKPSENFGGKYHMFSKIYELNI